MDPVSVISAITAAVQLGQQLYSDYEQGKVVLSATDAQAVKDALTQAEAATAALRPLVDQALDAASKQ